jgi:MFS family permease
VPRSNLPPSVVKMREDYRSKAISPFYSGKWHFILSLLFASVLIIFGLIQIDIESWWQWLFIPITFIIANIVEYVAHRFLLHQSNFKLAYREHTLLHHFFFTHEALEIESTQDFHRVLFSPYAVFFFIFIIGLPVFLLMGFIFGQVVGWVSFIVGVSYYALYEVVHTCCHLPDKHWVFAFPALRFLKKFHRFHHDLELMKNYNFNVLFPLSDVLFGTYYRK